jgi:hypothetical protein
MKVMVAVVGLAFAHGVLACGSSEGSKPTGGMSTAGQGGGGSSAGNGGSVSSAGSNNAGSVSSAGSNNAGGGNSAGNGGSGGHGGAVTYPGFPPANCFGPECPHGPCGSISQPSCTGSYNAPFDADYPDYCLASPDASYCVGSSTLTPGAPRGETYCINCVDGKPTFQHCRDEGAKIENGIAACMHPF